MTPRELMTLALQLMGLWFIVRSLWSALVVLSSLLRSPPPLAGSDVLARLFSVSIGAGFGLVLVLVSGRIAAWFYPHVSEPHEEPNDRLNVADIYRVASFMVGVFVLVVAVGPTSVTLVETVRGNTLISRDVAISQVETILYVPLGLLLIFGSKGISRFMSSIRYDPEKVASPQFSLRLMIVVTAICALIFGLVRYLASIP